MESCHLLGLRYAEGNEVHKDESRAAALFKVDTNCTQW
jgi:hypothetical protein